MAEPAAHVGRDGLADLGDAGRWRVVGVAVLEGLLGGADDVPGCVEVGLADAEEDDAAALRLQGFGAGEGLECGLRSQAGHA